MADVIKYFLPILIFVSPSCALNGGNILKRLQSLEDIVIGLKNTVTHLEKENRQLKFHVDSKAHNKKAVTLADDGLNKDSENVELHHPIPRLLLEGSSASQYAFYAYMSHDEPDPGAHHLLIYDVIQTNVGNAYNQFTGIFTIPQDGVYSFTWSTRVACHNAHTTELVVNTKVLGSTYVYCGYNTVTGHVITTASKGQAVYVRTHETAGGSGAIKSDQFGRSAFSGFLIH